MRIPNYIQTDLNPFFGNSAAIIKGELFIVDIESSASINNIEDLDEFKKWKTNEAVLGEACKFAIFATSRVMSNPVHYRKTLVTLDNFVLSLERTFGKTRGNSIKSIPYGQNWYSFSILVPNFLSIYIFLRNSSNKSNAVALIARLIESPFKSLGYSRNEVNSVYMTLPYIIVYYILKCHNISKPSVNIEIINKKLDTNVNDADTSLDDDTAGGRGRVPPGRVFDS